MARLPNRPPPCTRARATLLWLLLFMASCVVSEEQKTTISEMFVPKNRLPPRSGFGEQEDPLMDWVERWWLIPCSSRLPEPAHGLCNVAPAGIVGLSIVGIVALLSWCEKRGVAKQEKLAGKKD